MGGGWAGDGEALTLCAELIPKCTTEAFVRSVNRNPPGQPTFLRFLPQSGLTPYFILKKKENAIMSLKILFLSKKNCSIL